MTEIDGLNLKFTSTGATETVAKLDQISASATRTSAAVELAQAKIASTTSIAAAKIELLRAQAAKADAAAELSAARTEQANLRMVAAAAKAAEAEARKADSIVASNAKIERSAALANDAKLKALLASAPSGQMRDGQMYASELPVPAEQAAATAAARQLAAAQAAAAVEARAFAAAQSEAAAAEALFAKGASDVGPIVNAASAVKKLENEAKNVVPAIVPIVPALNEVGKVSGQVAREVGVLGNEFAKGNYTRFEGSLITLANRMNLLPKLINNILSPLGLLELAALAVGIGFVKVSLAEDKLNEKLIATGGITGLTTSSFNELAKSIETTTSGATGAKDALTVLVTSGRLSGQALRDAATAAVSFGELTGEGAKKAAKEIEKIADEPVKAIREVDKQYHFLTGSIYDQIKALDESGNHTAAVALGYKTMAEESVKRVKEAENELTNLGRYLDRVKKNVIETGDEFVHFINGASDVEKFQDVTHKLIEARGQLNNDLAQAARGESFGGRGAASDVIAADRADVEAAHQANFKLQNAYNSKQLEAQKKHDVAQTEEAKKAASDLLSVEDEKNGRSEKKRIQIEIDRLKAAMTTDGVNRSPEQHAEDTEALANLEKAYAKAGVSRTKLTDAQKAAKKLTSEEASDYKSMTVQLDEIIARNKAQADSTSKLTGDEKTLVDIQAKLNAVNEVTHKLLIPLNSEQRKLNEAKLAAATLAVAATKESDLQSKADKEELSTKEKLTRTTEQLQHGYEKQLKLLTLGKRAAEEETALDEIRVKAKEDLRAAIAKAAELGTTLSEEHIQQIAEMKAAEKQDLADAKDYYAKRTEYESNWANGFNKALVDLNDNANNVADNVYKITQNAYDGMANSLANLVNGGKAGFKELAVSVLKQIEMMIIKMLILKAVSAFLGSGFGGAGGGTYGNHGAGDVYAKGGVFSGGSEVTAFANGGVVNSPTLFPMAKGMGLMGEAGPEAVMPLTRGSDGKLGVKSQGGSGEISVTIINNIGSDGSTTSAQSGSADKQARDIAALMKAVVVKELTNAQRPGGTLYNAGVRA